MKVFRSVSFFSYGIKQTNNDLLQFVRFNLLILAITFFFTYISALAAIKITYSRYMQEVIVLLFSFPFVTYTAAGTMYYYISFSKGITVRLNQMYRAYRWFKHYLLYAFCLVFVYLIFWKRIPMIFDMLYENTLPIAAGSAFFLFLVVRLFFLPVVLVDTKLTFEESIIQSLRLSRGAAAEICIFVFISLCLAAAGLLLFGAGILYSAAVVIFAYIKFYREVRDGHNST